MHDITILIPTYNRQMYLKRLLCHYKDSNINIVVVDGSKETFSHEYGENVNYYHLNKKSYLERLAFALDIIKTKYVVICSDDDLITINSLNEHILFLENNNDYVISQGTSLFFNTKFNRFNVLSHRIVSNNTLGDKAQIRLKQSFDKYTHAVYVVVQLKLIKKIFKEIVKYNIKDIMVVELLTVGIYAIHGKFNFSNSLYYYQENLENSLGNIYSSYSISKENKRDHESLRLILSEYLYKNSELSQDTSIEFINKELNDFLTNAEDSFLVKFKKIIRKKIPNIFFKYRQLNHAKETEKKTYLNLSDDDKKEFNKIKEFINGYDLK